MKAVKRHGKHLWFELDRRPWPCLHFGMTGGFHTAPGGPHVKLQSSGTKPDRAEELTCEENDFIFLMKPFLGETLVRILDRIRRQQVRRCFEDNADAIK